jgi:putative peptide modification system cyclase
VTAEVIDPITQTTVYSESADGVGEASVLPSLDAVNQKLRVRLGEALATVSKESKPLVQAATANLDALRAYSAGHGAYNAGRMKEALALFQQAVKLDPDFGLAHLWISQIHVNAGEYGDFKTTIGKAAALHDRLSPRDALFVDTLRAEMESGRATLEKAKLLASMYPDFYPAWGVHAYFAWKTNQYGDATESLMKSAVDRNAHRVISDYLLGIVYLAQEEEAKAMRAFSTAADGGFGRTEYAASAFASGRKFNQAVATLARSKLSGRAADDIDVHVPRIAFAIDQGHWKQARDAIAAARRDATAVGPSVERWFMGMELGLHSVAGTTSSEALTDYLRAEKAALAAADNAIERGQIRFHIVFVAYLAARNGDAKLAADALVAAGDAARSANEPVLSQLATIADLEIERATGRIGGALGKLKMQLDGSELYLAHVALMDAQAARGDHAAALIEARWLATHRGRAYAEYGAHQYLTTFNVAQSDIALLHMAELSTSLGDMTEARKAIDRFQQIWPLAELPEAITARVKIVTARL